jgi:hypothetical protein
MKKKLEADLMSIAHRVLQIKNKSDINQLCIETRKLYEKLAILQFVEEHFEGAKPTIGQAEIIEKMKQFFEENHLSDSKPIQVKDEIVVEEIIEEEISIEEIVAEEIEEVVEEIIEEEISIEEIVAEEIEEVVEEVQAIELEEAIITESLDEELSDIGFQPAFELEEDEEISVEEIETKPEEVQISFMDLLGGDYSETLFVKVDQSQEIPTPIVFDLPSATDFQEEKEEAPAEMELNPNDIEPKTISINDTFAKGIHIDLNDKIAFVKHLFGNSDEDYNRVLNQLITYDSFEEAQNFIEDMVKPDYNSWEGKEDYSQRFIEIIEKKFA